MTSRWQHYRQAVHSLPSQTLAWPFGGRGLDSVGVGGQPVLEPVPCCGEDEILVRVDALGLCASDAKMVRMGGDYPLFFDRDFAADPARLGHEAALTVVAVGKRWRRHASGLRLGIQPDVYLNGQRAIFGVNIAGAMTQYLTLGRDHRAGQYIFVFDIVRCTCGRGDSCSDHHHEAAGAVCWIGKPATIDLHR